MTPRAIIFGVIVVIALGLLFVLGGGFMRGDCLNLDDAPPCAEVQEAK